MTVVAILSDCEFRSHGYAWNVEIDAERIVTSSGDPEYDACRVLAARGLRGRIDFVDGITGRPRISIASIEVAARYRVADESRDGLRLRLRREAPVATRRGSPRTAPIVHPGTGHLGNPNPVEITHPAGADMRRAAGR
jgi:hypothetical protein